MSLGIPFGKYRLIRRLARGGMAEVFLATQKGPEGFERTVAIKRILPHLADVPQFVQMFMDEARLAAQLSHPNIAHIYEFGETEDAHFIAMEYIRGVDLSVVVLDGPGRALPLEHAARIIADVCAALHYAHNMIGNDDKPVGLVHRDISPQNVIVSFDGAVKILDFGIAKAAHHVERTQPGVVRGKYSYMSPEQVEGRRLDARSDLFSAGILLYELCTAGPLFPRTDAVQAMYAIRNTEAPQPLRDGAPLPSQLEQIIRRALARDLDARYQHAAEMQLELEQYLRGADRISNSIVLAEYFSGTYRKGEPTPEAGAPGTPSRPDATERVVEQGQGLPGARSDATVKVPQPDAASDTVEQLRSEDLELIPQVSREVTAALDSSPGGSPDSATAAAETRAATPAALARQQERPGPRRGWRLEVALAAGVVVLAGVGVGYLLSGSLPGSADPGARSRGPDADAGMATVTPTTPRRSAVLRIASTPTSARVKVDGTPLPGVTPVRHHVVPGTHTVLVSAEGYSDSSQVVQLEPDQTLRVNLVLRRAARVVSLRDEPAEQVTPKPRRPRPRVARRPVARRKQRRASPTPPPRPVAPPPVRQRGYLTITTIPWSRVSLGRRQLGITPLARVPLPAGKHQLRLHNPNGQGGTQVVTIRAGQVTKLRLRLGR